MDLDEPIDKDSPHPFIDVGLVLHVDGPDRCIGLPLPEERVHVLDVVGSAERIFAIALVNVIDLPSVLVAVGIGDETGGSGGTGRSGHVGGGSEGASVNIGVSRGRHGARLTLLHGSAPHLATLTSGILVATRVSYISERSTSIARSVVILEHFNGLVLCVCLRAASSCNYQLYRTGRIY